MTTTPAPRPPLPPKIELLRAAQQFAIDPTRADYRVRLRAACDAMRLLVNAGGLTPTDTAPWDFLAECELALCEPPSAAAHVRVVIRTVIENTGHLLEVGGDPKPPYRTSTRPNPQRRGVNPRGRKAKKREPNLSWQQRADLQ